MSLKDLRNRIKCVQSTQKITSAMKMVSSAKLSRLQDKMICSRQYLAVLNNIGNNLGKSLHDSETSIPWLKNDGKELVIIFGAEKGLCGGFYSNIIRTSLDFVKNISDCLILVFGRKTSENLSKNYKNNLLEFNFGINSVELSTFQSLSKFIENEKLHGRISKVHVVGSSFKNILTQAVNIQTICPFNFDSKNDRTILEPSSEEFLNHFFNTYVSTLLYKFWIETYTCEVASRMTAMDNATRNATDVIADLSLQYNRTRQAKITTELIEIISGSQSVN